MDAIRESITLGELYFIDEHITQIAMCDPMAVNRYGFMPFDLPAKQGLAYFDAGEGATEASSRNSVVLSWISLGSTENAPHGSVVVFVHGDKQQIRSKLSHPRENYPHYDSEQPDYVFAGAINVRFSEEGEPLEFTGPKEDMGYWVFLPLSTCHLIRQQLTETVTESPDRASRRRHQRAGLAPPQVRVSRLRQSARPAATNESQKEWHHKWIVRGHWRKQWYPSIQAHRPIWIAPHLKGPGDAPLLGGERVHLID
ncbi:hypothetical protein [Saccharopolyspora shandongensis]|uniref:hypothetical protein n=1 Tax=Saccharopolyspora shandongensis TaxID=418495 RepID=UPI0033CFCAB3